jgi:uncharacterized protein YlxW (UPF0749 family)
MKYEMELVSLILNVLFGGGLLLTVFTLKSAAKKASAEAENAELENDEKASKLLMDYIVEPLKKEINGLRKDVRRLQKAIDKIVDCAYADDCPVRSELRKQREDNEQ